MSIPKFPLNPIHSSNPQPRVFFPNLGFSLVPLGINFSNHQYLNSILFLHHFETMQVFKSINHNMFNPKPPTSSNILYTHPKVLNQPPKTSKSTSYAFNVHYKILTQQFHHQSTKNLNITHTKIKPFNHLKQPKNHANTRRYLGDEKP